MLRMDPSALRVALGQLEQAAADQAEWHENLLRSIFCGLLCDPDDLAAFAHRLCRFGRWYYEKAPAELRRLPAFAALGLEHEQLHKIAARLLRQVGANISIGRGDFADLVATSARLRLEVDALKSAVEGALRNRDFLTGACGRVEMLPELRNLRARASQEGRPCCIVFMDIDNLKHINDTYGHQVGDSVLTGAVRYASEHLRPDDKGVPLWWR
jgi:diguanylate cyclase